MPGTSQDDVQKDIESEPTEGDTSGGGTTPQPTELDSVKKTLAETQAQLKRYQEKDSGHEEGVRKLQDKIAELESRIPQAKTEESSPDLSDQDKEYRNYLKRLGYYAKSDVDKMVQERIAPLQAKEQAKARGEQKRILSEFIKGKPELSESKDPDGTKMQRVIARLKRIAPEDPLEPNLSLNEDLETAYKWAFEEETNQEALIRAKNEGRAEGHEASETKVGEGASTSSPSSKKQYSPEAEEVMREWGVDDESLTKQNKNK